MKKILIVWALSQEINIIKEEIKKLDLRNIKTSFLTTWMWNYNMILNLTRFLEKHDFDIVLNIWVCGYLSDLKEKFIQVWRVKNLANNRELIIPKIINFWKISTIFSSEKIVYEASSLPLGEIERGTNFVDMESYGFEMVCDSFKVPRIILKVVVDKIWEETKNFDFKKAEKNLRNNIDYKELFLQIDLHLEKHFDIWKWKYKIHNDNIELYNKNFNFTFSEKEIFKKLYNLYYF